MFETVLLLENNLVSLRAPSLLMSSGGRCPLFTPDISKICCMLLICLVSQDASPKGEFVLHRGPGYGVIEGIEGDTETAFAFTIITPNRTYWLHASSATYDSWLEAFGKLSMRSGRLF